MSLCPNYYDNENELCISCDFSEDCRLDCESYAAKHSEDFPQIMFNV